MKIILMRHGQPEIDLNSMKAQKFSPNCLGRVFEKYEFSNLKAGTVIPSKSLLIAKSCNRALSSDLPRAISSIQKLGIQDKANTDEIFRESPIPYPNWKKPYLSLFTWCAIFRVAWFLGFSRNGESIESARQRARLCTVKISQIVQTNTSVLILGHGIMNRLIGSELKEKGWRKTENTGENYWSYKVFESTGF